MICKNCNSPSVRDGKCLACGYQQSRKSAQRDKPPAKPDAAEKSERKAAPPKPAPPRESRESKAAPPQEPKAAPPRGPNDPAREAEVARETARVANEITRRILASFDEAAIAIARIRSLWE